MSVHSRERDRQDRERETSMGCVPHGLSPDRESNPQPISVRDDAQPTEPPAWAHFIFQILPFTGGNATLPIFSGSCGTSSILSGGSWPSGIRESLEPAVFNRPLHKAQEQTQKIRVKPTGFKDTSWPSPAPCRSDPRWRPAV